MSAKEANQKPVLHIEILPDEILGEIFHHATWVPYWIKPSDISFSYLQSSESKELHREFRLSLVTKKYLVRVCKSWYKIATPYLYQWLVLGRLESLAGLQTAVERKHSDYGDEVPDQLEVPAMGWYAKRLDITFRCDWDLNDDDESSSDSDDSEYRSNRQVEKSSNDFLCDLLRALPNLEVLTVKHSFDIYTDMIRPNVSYTYCPKLRIINWYHDYDTISPQIWYHFVASHPNLVAAQLPYIWPYYEVIPPPPQIPNTIQTCTIPLRSPIENHYLPSLERLILCQFASNDELRWLPELVTYASIPTLTTIQLNCTRILPSFSLYDEFVDFAPCFALFPNLRRIDIVLPLWPTCWPSELPPPFPSTVSVLGLRVVSYKPPKSLVFLFLAWLGRLVREAKSRLVIQFLDSRTMRDVLVHRDALRRKGAQKQILSSWLDPDEHLFNLELEDPPNTLPSSESKAVMKSI